MIRRLAPLVLAACAGGMSAPPGAPMVTGSFRAEDRVVLGNFSTVTAIAASFERVYVAYPGAVAIWRPLARRWEAPRSAPSPDALRRVRLAIVDPLDQSLWLAGDDGILHFEPLLERWDRMAAPGRVTALATDAANPGDGVWLRTESAWYRIPRIGMPQPATPPATLRPAPTLEDAYRDLPMLRATGPTLAVGAGLAPGRLTAAAPNPDGSGWFLGTDRAGLLRVDRVTLRAESIPLGLPGEVVGAVTAVPGGVWVATDADAFGNPAAISFVPDDLSRTTVHRGDPALGLGFEAVRRIAPGARALWLASDRGVARLPLDGGEPEWWTSTRGLRDDRVVSVLPWQDGVLAATLRGVMFIDRRGEVALPAPNLVDPVYALTAWRDTVWLGTAGGVLVLARGDSGASMPAGWRGIARRPVIGLGVIGDTLIAMTREHLIRRDPPTGEWLEGVPLRGIVGTPRALDVSPSGIWVGGERGAALVSTSGAPIQTLPVGRELPDAVTAIAAADRYLWVGTLRGVVRLALSGR